MSEVLLGIAAGLAWALGRKLAGDGLGGALAAAVYAGSPCARGLAAKDPRLAACVALLPLLLLLFYRMTEIPVDEESSRRRNARALLALCLAGLGLLDTRFAAAAALFVWVILLAGYAFDPRRRAETWAPPFAGWSWGCLGGVLLYSPAWLWRRAHPGALGGPLPEFPLAGADTLDLLLPSPDYVGLGALLLALAAVTLARSYRGQARLWGAVAALELWLALGADFLLGGRRVWWVPVLYRGARRLPWLGRVDPSLFALCGQLCLALLAAFGFGALIARLPPRALRWLRPLGAGALCGAALWDLFR